jgi:hypothetical protein
MCTLACSIRHAKTALCKELHDTHIERQAVSQAAATSATVDDNDTAGRIAAYTVRVVNDTVHYGCLAHA